MRSQQYKTIQSAPSARQEQRLASESEPSRLSDVLERLANRLDHLESRLDAIEARWGVPSPLPPAGPRSPSPLAQPVSQLSSQYLSAASISVSGSLAPASILSSSRELLLAPQDEQMVNFIRSRGHVCAEDVRVHFRYKGNNAASARLSRLYELGVLDKQQAGRKVYYRVR